ncbi:MAG TPA: PDZ domain-containing protein, partial [Kofleriaceae bacterium]|nr:PDZ domain-containing protein [Kofleriaceae bacterium]
ERVKLELTAHGRARIVAVVRDFRSGAPVPNAMCHAVMAVDGEQGLTSWDLASAPRSDATGKLVIDPAPAGDVAVTCELPSARWSAPSATVTVARGGQVAAELLTAELAVDNRGTTGLRFDPFTTAPRIASVEPNSPAAKLGIQRGDLVTEVNGAPVRTLNGLGVEQLIHSTPIGSDVRIRVLRDATTKTFVLRVGPA